MFKEDDTNWRSVATRNMLLQFWKKYRISKNDYRLFELGPGGGGTLSFFQQFAKVFGQDISELSVRYCRQRGIRNVILGDARKHLPWKDNSFDLCIALDVIEHIKDDQQVMNELYRVCNPGGLVLTVIPACQFLWSQRDVRLRHYKRYSTREIRELAENAGFRLLRVSYINFWYFPLLYLAVRIKKGKLKTDIAAVPRLLNWLLKKSLDMETAFMKIIDFPVGCSTISILGK